MNLEASQALVVGAGQLSKQLISCLSIEEIRKYTFYDDISDIDQFLNRFPILSSPKEAQNYFDKVSTNFIIGVAGVKNRKNLTEKFIEFGGTPISFISSLATISPIETFIANGTIILSNSYIETCSKIGKHTLVNVGVTICHDSEVGEYCEIAPGSILTGGCKVGNNCFIGAGAILLPHIEIGDNVIIGAGAVVTKNVVSNSLVKGIPAR